MQLLKSGHLTLTPYYYLVHGLYSVFVNCPDTLLMQLFTPRWELTVGTPRTLHPLLQSGVVVPYLWRKNKREVHGPRGEASKTLPGLSRHGEVAASSLDLQMPLYCAWFWGSPQT